MSEQTPPELAWSKFSVGRWLESLEQRKDPTGIPVQHVRWALDATEESLPYLFPTDPWGGSTVRAGMTPRYLGDEPDESGVGVWYLVAPCVAVIASLDKKHRVVLEAIAVVSRSEFDRVQQKMRRPEPALMRSLTSLIHLPRVEQRRLTKAPDPTPPTSLPEGREP